MNNLLWLSETQMRRIGPYFPLSHYGPRVDDQRIASGIIYVIKHGLMWRDAPVAYGPHKTIYNRFIRWSRPVVFNRIFAELAGKAVLVCIYLSVSGGDFAVPMKRAQGCMDCNLNIINDEARLVDAQGIHYRAADFGCGVWQGRGQDDIDAPFNIVQILNNHTMIVEGGLPIGGDNIVTSLRHGHKLTHDAVGYLREVVQSSEPG